MKTDKALSYGIVAFVAICMIGAFGVLGVPTFPASIRTIGYWNITENSWGTAIFQNGLHNAIQYNAYHISEIDGTTAILTHDSGSVGLVTFGRDDIIFDAEGNLYTESNQKYVDTIQKEYGLKLVRGQIANRVDIPAETLLFIVNPSVAGAVAVQFPTRPNINLEDNTITFAATTQTISVHVYTTLPHFEKNL